jgi:hypothetical protein
VIVKKKELTLRSKFAEDVRVIVHGKVHVIFCLMFIPVDVYDLCEICTQSDLVGKTFFEKPGDGGIH